MRHVGRRLLAAGALFGVAIVAAGCGGGPTPLNVQVQQWASSIGYSGDIAQIQSDLRSLSNGLRLRELPQLRTECEGFGVDVEALYGELPSPDHTITDEFGSSLSGMYTASRDCYDAKSFTSASFRTYQRELAQNLTVYDQARRRMTTDHAN